MWDNATRGTEGSAGRRPSRLLVRLVVRPAAAVPSRPAGGASPRRANQLAHEHGSSELCDLLEAFALEHGDRAKPEAAGAPSRSRDRVCLHGSSALGANRLEGHPKGRGRHPLTAVAYRHHETDDPPYHLGRRRQLPVGAPAVDPGELLLPAIGAPADGLVAGVGQDSVGAPLMDERLDPAAVVLVEAAFLDVKRSDLLLRALLATVVHAPALIVSAGAAEQAFKVGPRLGRQFPEG